jgi:hypothetical protein
VLFGYSTCKNTLVILPIGLIDVIKKNTKLLRSVDILAFLTACFPLKNVNLILLLGSPCTEKDCTMPLATERPPRDFVSCHMLTSKSKARATTFVLPTSIHAKEVLISDRYDTTNVKP